MKKIAIFLPLLVMLFGPPSLSAQNRGMLAVDDAKVPAGSAKLIVIGISRYKNVPSLNYAHSDAKAFYNFMTSPGGGGIEQANARILLDEEATAANIWASVYWLLESVKEGDNVIFYFAGHGDLERKTISQLGFLLAADAPKVMYPVGGTLPVNMLQEYINTLVQVNKARVIMITDACHSGKLAGGLEGAANTATALQSQWNNTIKILSSQPGELSQEGVRWNGGGGVFTFYLMKGLMGFADRNLDGKITAQELNIYLMTNVPRETGFSQNPTLTGDQAAILAGYDTAAFASMKDNAKEPVFDTRLIAQRGFEDEYKKTLDSSTYHEYEKFRFCIENHFLVDSNSQYGSAWDIYQGLKNDKKAAAVINTMKFALLSALQDNYLRFANFIINNVQFNEIEEFTRTVLTLKKELGKAIRLIDSTYLLYDHIYASYLMATVIDNMVNNTMSVSNLSTVEKAIELEPDNALFYLFEGVFYRSVNDTLSLQKLTKSLELAPTSIAVMDNFCATYQSLKDYNKAVMYAEQAIKYDPSFLPAYLQLSHIYLDFLHQKEKGYFYLHIADSIGDQLNLSYIFWLLGENHNSFKDTVKAIHYYERDYALDTSDYDLISRLADLYSLKTQTAKAELFIHKCIGSLNEKVKADPGEMLNYYYLAVRYSQLNKKEEALKNLELWFHLKIAAIKKEGRDENEYKQEFIKYLEKENTLVNIKDTEEFKNLLRKSF